MKGSVYNRDSFLKDIANKLGRNRKEGVMRPKWKHQVNWETLSEASQEELLEQFKIQCAQIHTDVIDTSKKETAHVLESLIKQNGLGAIMTSKDERFKQYKLTSLFQRLKKEGTDVSIWDPDQTRSKNLQLAEKAKYGIVFSDYTLAESGTIVVKAHQGQGRAIHFLPMIYIVCIEKSTIVPRMIQATFDLNKSVVAGNSPASAIHFISGPSNSADIEMNLVVGVHGPVKAIYVVIDDEKGLSI
ncbi:LutC/YkgG family protein [Bacillus sp. NPDC077027]|uniref:LutC/YkgG family protein n=1 Tax=Bacillus sp. NPDC077027 TaxID=3390548 RepID=UPI003D03AAA9